MTDYRFMLKKRSKKRNFSEREVSILTEEYKKHILILNSKLTNSITNQKKQRIWERITEAINAVGVNRRRVSEVKEKWRNMQRKARRIFAERKFSLAHLEGPAPSNSVSNHRARMVEKPLVDIEPLAGVTVAASTSSTNNMVDDNNHGVAIGSENGSLQVNSNHRTDDKPSVNNSHCNNDSNGADLNDHLTIVIKEEIPDPVLKNDDLILTTIQSEPAEGDLADRTPLELVTPSIGCDTSPPARNTVGSYGGFPSHNYNTKLVSTPEDNSSVYTTPQSQHWSSRVQAPSQVSSSKLHSLSGVSMSSNNIRIPTSSLTSPRSYATTHVPSEKSNNISVSSSLVLNNSIPDTLASLSSNSFINRSHPLVTGGPSLSHLSQDTPVVPSVSHTKPSNRGTTTSGGITQADLLQLQYEVLLADKKRILTQTRYYEMKMKRIELELCGQTNSFF